MQPRNITNMTNINNDSPELSDSPNQVEDSTFAKYGEGLSSRAIDITSNEQLDAFESDLRKEVVKHNFKMDSSVENWLDSEFNRIYVAYAYPDVTKVH